MINSVEEKSGSENWGDVLKEKNRRFDNVIDILKEVIKAKRKKQKGDLMQEIDLEVEQWEI